MPENSLIEQEKDTLKLGLCKKVKIDYMGQNGRAFKCY